MSDLVPSEPEKKLIEEAAAGREADFSGGERPVLRAKVIAALCARLRPDWPVHSRGVRIRGARIEGRLNLNSTRIEFPLVLLDCELAEPLSLIDAETRTIRMTGSSVPGIDAQRLWLKGALLLDRGFNCKGEVQLLDARIEGTVEATGAKLENPGGRSFDGRRMSVAGSLFLGTSGFHSVGEFHLGGAEIGINLNAVGAVFENPGKNAIMADGLRVRGPVLLREAQVRGTVRLLYADLGATLECDGMSISDAGGHALYADGLKTGSNVFFRKQFHASAEISLRGARIGGVLDCTGATLGGLGGVALRADRAHIEGDVVLTRGFHSHGSLLFRGTQVQGYFVSEEAVFENPGDMALMAEELVTGGPILLRKGFQAKGEVNFNLAKVGSNLDCSGGIFENPGKVALGVGGISVKGSVQLRNGFRAIGAVHLVAAGVGEMMDFRGAEFGGEVLLHRAHIRGDLLCVQCKFAPAGRILVADGAKIEGSLVWTGMQSRPEGLLSLSGTSAARLIDHEKSWPTRLRIDGFTYDAFAYGAPLSEKRLDWIRLQEEFSPQPYEQAAKVLRSMGHEREARRISRAKQDDRRRFGNLSWPARVWNLVLGLTIGHGYQVWRALLILLGLIAVGALVFNAAYDQGVMLAIKPSGLPKPLKFEPLTYSIDVCLPIIDLHQERYWLPLKRGDEVFWYRFYFWSHIGLGWLVTTLAVTGLTGLVKKD